EATGETLEDSPFIGRERHFGGSDLATFGGCLHFLETYRSYLRLGEHRLSDFGIVERGHRHTESVERDLAPLHGGDRREWHLTGAIPGGIDVGHRGALHLVDTDVAVIGLDTRLLQPEALGERDRPDRQEGV